METEIFTLDESFLNRDYTNSAFKMYKILKAYSENKEKGIRVAKEYIKSKNTFINTVNNFSKKYSNASDFAEMFNEIANSYDSVKKKQTKYIDTSVVSQDVDEKHKLLKRIYDSGLSVLDYFFYNHAPLGFSTFFTQRCNRKDKLALEINNRNNKTYPIIVKIINQINNDEIDYVGYYEITKLNPYLLINIAKENGIYTDTLAIFIRALRLNNQLNVEKELNGTLVINEEQIPREIKEQAIEYLNSINAPIDTVVYNNMVKRLVKKSSK